MDISEEINENLTKEIEEEEIQELSRQFSQTRLLAQMVSPSASAELNGE